MKVSGTEARGWRAVKGGSVFNFSIASTGDVSLGKRAVANFSPDNRDALTPGGFNPETLRYRHFCPEAGSVNDSVHNG